MTDGCTITVPGYKQAQCFHLESVKNVMQEIECLLVMLTCEIQWNRTLRRPRAYSQKAKEALKVLPEKQSLAFISMTDLVTFCTGNIFTQYQARVQFSSDSETPP